MFLSNNVNIKIFELTHIRKILFLNENVYLICINNYVAQYFK